MENAATHFGSMTQLLTEYNRFLLLNWVVGGSLGAPRLPGDTLTAVQKMPQRASFP